MPIFHQESIAKKKPSIEYWKQQPLSPEKYRYQFKKSWETKNLKYHEL